MLKEALRGAAAGAVGTAVLNTTTYGDMALRGRPASDMPAKTAGKLADKAHIRLQRPGEEPDKKQNRVQALGALSGYAVGIGLGITYGLIGDRIPDKAKPFAALGVGAAATLASAGPMVALGLTDPRKWDREAWLSDLVPHMAYGAATVAGYRAMSNGKH